MKAKSSSSSTSTRFIENSCKDYEPGDQKLEPQILLEEILPFSEAGNDHFMVAFQQYQIEHPPTLSQRVKSDGYSKIDPSIYSGSGGCIYVYWRIALHFKRLKKEKQYRYYLGLAQKAYEVNLALFDKKKREGCASFFMSVVGPLTLGYIIGEQNKNEEQQVQCFQRIIEEGERECYHKYSQDQLLYGNAGYLYALLLIYTHTVQKERKEELEPIIGRIVKQLIRNGRYKGFQHLIFPFPKDQGKLYLGGAHGLAGVLYLLLRAIQIVPDGDQKLISMVEAELLKKSCYFTLLIQFDSGNFPSSLGKTDDLLVHFCHGAPGFISFLCEAYKYYKDVAFKIAAQKAGEHVWKKGILKKGNSICHGIAGNSYVLNTLSTICEDDFERYKWKYRSLAFTKLTYDKTLQEKIRKLSAPFRKVAGVSDSPLSLMDGKGGDICLYADVQSESRKFPGFEI